MSELAIGAVPGSWRADPSGLWTVAPDPAASHRPGAGTGVRIDAVAAPGAGPVPYVEHRLSAATDLRGYDELRVWVRSTRPATAGADEPFYLAIEADSDPASASGIWRRLLPVDRRDTWQLHRLWLGDLPEPARRALAVLRIRSLDRGIAFRAAVDDLVAVRPQPISDTDAALMRRLDGTFSVTAKAGTVSAIVQVPEIAPTSTRPLILIVPWAVVPLGTRGSVADITDNHTPEGVHVRPAPAHLQLDYALDALADDRTDKAELLDQILDTFVRDPILTVADAPVEVTLLDAPPSTGSYGSSSFDSHRTPLYVRVVVTTETGDRRFHERARPFLLTAPADSRAPAEALTL
jgi:hypothetical protein